MAKVKTKSLLLIVKNKPGVLESISAYFHERDLNLEEVIVADSERKSRKRVSLTFSGENIKMYLILAELKKTPNVEEVRELVKDNILGAELLLVKIYGGTGLSFQNNSNKLTEIIYKFKAQVVHYGEDYYIVQLVDTSEVIDDFLKSIKPFKVLEISRSGSVNIEE